MNKQTVQLLERHFDTAFAAPDGIKKLRELILAMAMQGKLVPQDPQDQPASELLKEIEAEKRRLVKAGKIKVPKPLPEIKLEEVPYELPKGWEWVRLGEIGDYNGRGNIDPTAIGSDTWLLDLEDIEKDTSQLLYRAKYSDRQSKSTKSTFQKGDVLYGKLRPYLDKVIVADSDGVCTTEIVPIVPSIAINSEFLRWLLKRPGFLAHVNSLVYGVKMPRLGTEDAVRSIHPLPPLAEQRRIVAKIDQLMARCDELEKLRAEREQKRLTVHTAALNRLLMATKGDGFSTAWHFISQHFGELYSVKENVAELRKTILQLAVMGKLVPQDPQDQPASALLQEIEVEKKRLVKAGKIKAPKPLPEIKPEEVPYQLPPGWEWVRLGSIAMFENGDRSSRYPNETDHQPSGVPFFGAKDMVAGVLRYDNGLRFISEAKFSELSNGKLVDKDFVVLLRGTVGKMAIFRENLKFSTGFINAQMLIVRMLNKKLCEFFNSYSSSIFFQSLIAAQITGSAVRQMPANVLLDFLVPLPPLAEQHSIVAKIDQLMAHCEEIDKQIDAANGKQTALLNAVMAQV
ncbi:MAG: hypothetical protein A2505_00580 [Deltaproteobacteria bacterium RIFOXYD12_FULL_55_16]|nr:MAG: hypothetical protein A2505_00580 [Deltaproteobacteria bacterium RIFOXYD12_FULL_55_16]